MAVGLADPSMPDTGGRADIGPMPAWAAVYLLSQDPRAKRVTLGTADAAGTWQIHYRDKKTGRPVSLADYPYMTILGNPGDAVNQSTGKSEAFPDCAGDCSSPNQPDSAHQPSFAYLPYLLTGDRFYLEELQFWASYDMFQSNPYYRDFEKGLVHSDQARGQGWSMRTIGETAYITPDSDPMKGYFVERVGYNIDWYNAQYTKSASANPFGFITNGSTVSDGKIAPWMDDFFTWSIGHVVDLGFDEAAPLRDWKAKFQIARMMDPGFCWILGSVYHLSIQDPTTEAAYSSYSEIYAHTLEDSGYDPAVLSAPCGGPEMAAALGLQEGEMVGYSTSAEGYPSNMQPALAVAAGSNAPMAKEAWDRFMARSVKPDYSSEPQFAVVPR